MLHRGRGRKEGSHVRVRVAPKPSSDIGIRSRRVNPGVWARSEDARLGQRSGM